MGEHRNNVMHHLAEAGGSRLSAEVLIAFSPKPNVLVLPADRIRQVEGGVEIYSVPPVLDGEGRWVVGKGEEVWQSPVPGVEVVPQGDRVPIDKLDVTVNLVATSVGGMVDANGRVVGRRRHLRELFREDAGHFLATLSGSVS